jgi:hypothetical protein
MEVLVMPSQLVWQENHFCKESLIYCRNKKKKKQEERYPKTNDKKLWHMHQHILVNLMLFLYKLIKDTCEKKRH